MKTYRGIGLMSGTSMDGLDMAYCRFEIEGEQVQFQLEAARSVPFDERWYRRLSLLIDQSAEIYAKTDVYFGHFLGKAVQQFIQEEQLQPDFVASHGQTIFHQPDKNFTAQIGDGETLVSYLDCPLVTNFRNKDVALQGQGAPLIPLVEHYLFPEYALFLNLGGFSNLSFRGTAFDISSANGILNYLYQAAFPEAETPFDPAGQTAASGRVHPELLEALNALPFYQLPPPKSLGWEWVMNALLPLVAEYAPPIEDALHTLVIHQCQQIARAMAGLSAGPQQVLVTGGGQHNRFMMDQLTLALQPHQIRIAQVDSKLIDFKEAIGFAFLGLRCLLGLPTVQAGATGASLPAVTGSIHVPPQGFPIFH